ncbi:alpha/beta hydrolase [Pantoea sp. FN060301]|uniref:alpha/beta hydrolase n=1 Tax=Pantoea sp. FN060301 TaxID=3420380 RepID=UPI003D16E67A
MELRWNTPQEWRPDGPTKKGILLIHGLGDAPGSFTDIAPELARQGFLVRSVLLPGHGTQPKDLSAISVNDWRRVVSEQAAILQKDAGKIWLGGFSTGANLAIEYTYRHPEVQGMVLFSPAVRANEPLVALTPFIVPFRQWLKAPRDGYPEQRATRYMRVPTNGFAQFWYSSRAAQAALNRHAYDKPVLMVMTEHDSVLDTPGLLKDFDRQFTSPRSRLIWYGNPQRERVLSRRVLMRPDALPQQRISQFSHMSVLFSPQNPVYGVSGSDRMCENGQREEDYLACRQGAEVWFSAWGYQESGKIHARLTWNPWFSWQNEVMADVVNGEDAKRDAG